MKTSRRISRSKAHRRIIKRRRSFFLTYDLEIPAEEVKLIKLIRWYLTLVDKMYDPGTHPGYVTSRTEKKTDYPTKGQINRYSLKKEIDEQIDEWIKERV